MKIPEKKLNDIVLTMNTPYTGDVVVTLSLGSKEVWTEELYAEEGNISVILPALRKNCYKCTIDTGKETEVHTIDVMLEDLLAQEKEEENFWETNTEKIKSMAREVVPDLDPIISSIQATLSDKVDKRTLEEVQEAVQQVGSIVDQKIDDAVCYIGEMVNSTTDSLVKQVKEVEGTQKAVVDNVKKETSKSLSEMKIGLGVVSDGVEILGEKRKTMDGRVRSAFDSIRVNASETKTELEEMKKTISQGKNIQPFFSTFAASGQESITPQGPFDTLTFAGSGITMNPTTRTITVTRGDVYKVGTPVDGQLAIRSGDGTVYGDPTMTFAPQQLLLGAENDSFLITGVSAVTTGNGGSFYVASGSGGATSGSGGLVSFRGGSSSGSSGNGGAASILGGSSVNGNGGSTSMISGASTNGNGGNLAISAGTGNLTTGTGGSITITAGNGLTKGTFSLRQREGFYKFASDGTSTATKQATLDFSAINTSAKTFSFPNTTGTIALTSDLAGFANTALSNLASVAINTSLISDTNKTDDLGSSTIKWRNLHTETVYADKIGYNSIRSVFGERKTEISELVDVLRRADKRFTVTQSIAGTVANLFDGDFETNLTIPVSSTRTININVANQSGVPVAGITYPEGKVYVHFYYTNNNYSTISMRVKENGVWYTAAAPNNISTDNTNKVLEFQVYGANYLTDIELTITTNGSDQVLVTAINYVCDRWTDQTESPYFDKYATTNNILGLVQYRNTTQGITGSINANGDWYMGTGGSGGKFGIGTSTPGTYHLNVVGNILGNDIVTNSGSAFQSLGVAYLRATSTNPIHIGDSAAQPIDLGKGGGAVAINTDYSNIISGEKLLVRANSATTSANILRLSGGATGFSGANDTGAYAMVFDGCAYQTSIVQVAGAKIEFAKENTWNYADTPTGTKGSLNFYTSAGTPNSPTLTKHMSINSAGDITAHTGKFIAATTVKLKGYTVATLPTGAIGDTAYVTDATAPTYLGALTGGGAVVCPVFYNGTAWVSN